MRRKLLCETLLTIALVLCVSNAHPLEVQLHRRTSDDRSLVQTTRQLGSWWDNILYHLGHHHGGGGSSGSRSGGSSSGGSSGSSSGGSSGSSGGGGSSSGGSSGSSGGSSGSSGGSSGSSGNGSYNGGGGNGDGGAGGGDDDGGDANADSSGGGTDGNDDYYWGDDAQHDAKTDDSTSTEDVADGIAGGISSRKSHLASMIMVACAIVGLVAGAALFLWKAKTDNNEKGLSPPKRKTAELPDNDYSLMGAGAAGPRQKPPARKRNLPRKPTPMRSRMFPGSRKDPLIDTKDYENDSDTSSEYSIPRAPGIALPPDDDGNDTGGEEGTSGDDDTPGEDDESCYSVYLEGQDEEESYYALTAASTDDESAPMDEAADRRNAQIVQSPPTPTPMDEQAIDATIRRTLMMGNEIMQRRTPQNGIPYIAGLTELDNV